MLHSVTPGNYQTSLYELVLIRQGVFDPFKAEEIPKLHSSFHSFLSDGLDINLYEDSIILAELETARQSVCNSL